MTGLDAARPFLALHIGLPKTGTTYLQHRVFARAEGLTFLHRTRGPRAESICHGFRQFARWNAPLFQIRGLLLRRLLRAYFSELKGGEGPPRLLVSDENISVLAEAFWQGQGSEPRRLAERLRTLSGQTPFGMPKVIIGIRRQDQWFASRYAESSKHYPEFSQEDFGLRVSRIIAAESLSGPLGWLDYDQVEQTFSDALGRENVLLLPLESLSTRVVFRTLGAFLGTDLGAPPRLAKTGRHRNQLSLGEDIWKMRAGGELRLEPGMRDAILARFDASNAALARRCPHVLDALTRR